ncbi:major facilitator superfamily domain-containing protein [Cercophora scortea]|uniref:Major facilitator superfamily domain-containing protein n=1 Tax=Cercophora scortea TaxID=314031 RepID=A0AAE0M6Y2_9PEZI|nr:major facilitator superfamily domain-containing protein [Cercophora scortea]
MPSIYMFCTLGQVLSCSYPQPESSQEPFHVFTKRERWFVIVIIGVAGLFSGLSSNIYFPALDQIATVSISPLIWGSFSDTIGRRPIYIASFSVYIAANIALSYSPNYAVLLIFRGLQAAGSASTVSIGNGVIQDISPLAEKGAFIAFYQAIRNFSIAIGPVLGGVFSEYLGFRSIFVFLLILSSLVLAMIVLFLPETLRAIAGNGSLRLTGVYKPLIHRLINKPTAYIDAEKQKDMLPHKRVTLMTFVDPLRLLAEPDILLNLLFGGVVYAIWSMVTSSTTRLFKQSFGLSEVFLGLAFLPNGLGTIFGSAIIGKLMTRDFLAAEAAYKSTHNLPADFKIGAKSLPRDFPIERARLRHLPWVSGLFVLVTACYGFSVAVPALDARPGWIAVPLLLQFVIAATSNAVFALNQTIVADLCPGKGAGATAVNNLVRCSLGAAGVAVVDLLINSVGVASAFLGLAMLTVACAPLAVMNWEWGMYWRAKRANRAARREMREMEMRKV